MNNKEDDLETNILELQRWSVANQLYDRDTFDYSPVECALPLVK